MRAPVTRGRNVGMTLIEMLVVLLIMGLLVSVTLLSTGILGRGSSQSEIALTLAEDLSRLFEHAGQQALAGNQVLSLRIDAGQQLSWWQWGSSSLAPEPQWIPVGEPKMAVLAVPGNIMLQVTPGAAPGMQSDNQPVVVFYPGREYSPFEIVLRNTDSPAGLARVWSESDGSIRWAAL